MFDLPIGETCGDVGWRFAILAAFVAVSIYGSNRTPRRPRRPPANSLGKRGTSQLGGGIRSRHFVVSWGPFSLPCGSTYVPAGRSCRGDSGHVAQRHRFSVRSNQVDGRPGLSLRSAGTVQFSWGAVSPRFGVTIREWQRCDRRRFCDTPRWLPFRSSSRTGLGLLSPSASSSIVATIPLGGNHHRRISHGLCHRRLDIIRR